MKLIAEYLDHVLQFEHLAEMEEDQDVKAALQGQAQAYRKLAADRTRKLGLTPDNPG